LPNIGFAFVEKKRLKENECFEKKTLKEKEYKKKNVLETLSCPDFFS